jgi:ATP-binding cassette subfamily F protein 3
MLLVNFSKVSKDYGGNPVFDEADLEVLEGERIGLIGENGSGKSTLLKLIAGLDAPTEGVVSRKKGLTMGYLPQQPDPALSHKTVFESVAEMPPDLAEWSARLHQLEAQMSDPQVAADPRKMAKVLEAYGTAQERFEMLGGYTFEHNVDAVLHGLGFRPEQYGQQVGSLSGGEKKLAHLARILLQAPDLLLLDEPDNHLDLEAKAWLEGYIRDYRGSVLIISHDRHLLDQVVNKIVELEDGQISVYAGNYSNYVVERHERLLRRYELYKVQQDEIRRLEAARRRLKGWAKINSKISARAASMEKRLERARQEAMERPVLHRERIKVGLDPNRSSRKVLEVKGLSKSVNGRALFKPFDLVVQYGERVGIVGPNGSGKTTLLKAMMQLIPPDSGPVEVGPSVVMGYYAQEQETLPLDQTPLDFIRSLKPMTEEAAVKFLRRLLFFYQDVRTPIRDLSGGEKSRLQIARLMLTDANLLLLDEPTNNLDIASSEVLEAALEEFEGTILAVSHDRYFLDKITMKTIVIGEDGEIESYPGNFSYYRSFAASLPDTF